jgi:hypothetical protein
VCLVRSVPHPDTLIMAYHLAVFTKSTYNRMKCLIKGVSEDNHRVSSTICTI